MTLPDANKLREEQLLAPVLKLFPKRQHERFTEAPLGSKRIDLLCISKSDPAQITSVELKIRDWKRALSQARVNFRAGNRSYIAIWHEHIAPPQRHIDTLAHYGVGLIVVYRTTARILSESKDPVVRIPRTKKASFYRNLCASV